jgi:muconate cycloisomerase
MMKIDDVDFTLIELADGRPIGTQPSLLVRLSTADNLEGWGEASGAWREGELEARRQTLLPILLGRSLFDMEELLGLDELRDSALRSAVEMAAWDLITRGVKRPLSHWFGGCFRRRVPLTIRVPVGPADQVAQLSRELAQLGYHSQVLLSSGEPEEDVRAVELIRQNVGDHLQLRLDGQARYDMETARDLCAELEYAQLECFTDPLLIMELHEMATLARQVNVPLAACRALRSPTDVFQLARLGSIQMAVIDSQYVGGLTAARKCAAVAEAAGLSMSLSCCSWSGVAAVAMGQLATALPLLRNANECTYTTLNHHILANAPDVADGMVAVPQGPGLGVEPDRMQIERLQAG